MTGVHGAVGSKQTFQSVAAYGGIHIKETDSELVRYKQLFEKLRVLME